MPKQTELPIEDPINFDYICLDADPLHTMNDLRIGEWDHRKVQESLASGFLRYAKQSEVDQAKENGRFLS